MTAKVFKAKKWYDDSVVLQGAIEKEYTAKRTGLQEIVNFIQSNDKHGDMADYYREVLAGEADQETFIDRIEEYLLDVKKENMESRLYNDNRVIWKYLKVLDNVYNDYKDKQEGF